MGRVAEVAALAEGRRGSCAIRLADVAHPWSENGTGFPRRRRLLATTVVGERLPGLGDAGSGMGGANLSHRTGFTLLSAVVGESLIQNAPPR
ncbi:MAG: hypothetical protein XXXNARYT_002625 [Candidatus Accumulibacter regalis]